MEQGEECRTVRVREEGRPGVVGDQGGVLESVPEDPWGKTRAGVSIALGPTQEWGSEGDRRGEVSGGTMEASRG